VTSVFTVSIQLWLLTLHVCITSSSLATAQHLNSMRNGIYWD